MLERFLAKVTDFEGCGLWTAYKINDGYGLFRLGKKMVLAHRFAYETLVGPIPEGLELHHRCENRACVGVSSDGLWLRYRNTRGGHLVPVTHLENVRLGRLAEANRRRGWQDHCGKGHPFTDANTYVNPGSGYRACRECRRRWDRQRATT